MGTNIRTIERDHETHSFVNQRVYTIGSSGNMELVANALRKIPDLMRAIDKAIEQQIKAVSQAGKEFENCAIRIASFSVAALAILLKLVGTEQG